MKLSKAQEDLLKRIHNHIVVKKHEKSYPLRSDDKAAGKALEKKGLIKIKHKDPGDQQSATLTNEGKKEATASSVMAEAVLALAETHPELATALAKEALPVVANRGTIHLFQQMKMMALDGWRNFQDDEYFPHHVLQLTEQALSILGLALGKLGLNIRELESASRVMKKPLGNLPPGYYTRGVEKYFQMASSAADDAIDAIKADDDEVHENVLDHSGTIVQQLANALKEIGLNTRARAVLKAYRAIMTY